MLTFWMRIIQQMVMKLNVTMRACFFADYLSPWRSYTGVLQETPHTISCFCQDAPVPSSIMKMRVDTSTITPCLPTSLVGSSSIRRLTRLNSQAP